MPAQPNPDKLNPRWRVIVILCAVAFVLGDSGGLVRLHPVLRILVLLLILAAFTTVAIQFVKLKKEQRP